MPAHMTLRMMKQKNSECSYMANFYSGLVSSIVRFTIFFNKELFNDGPREFDKLIMWTLIEPGVYLIAACLANLRPVWHFLNEKWISSWLPRPKTKSSTSTYVPLVYFKLGDNHSINAARELWTSSRKECEVNQPKRDLKTAVHSVSAVINDDNA